MKLQGKNEIELCVRTNIDAGKWVVNFCEVALFKLLYVQDGYNTQYMNVSPETPFVSHFKAHKYKYTVILYTTRT